MTTEGDVLERLRLRPLAIPQDFRVTDRLHLLCPPETTPETFNSAKEAFGPFGASVLLGFLNVSTPARMDEVQDLWTVFMRESMPTPKERKPGGEPLATVRTATLGWRLLALVGSAIEQLAGVASAVHEWRTTGQVLGLACPLGRSMLSFQTEGSAATARALAQFGTAENASRLLGYPDLQVMRRHVRPRQAKSLVARCGRSSMHAADIFNAAASVVTDPFWRTFMKWKHGSVATSPGSGPVWLRQDPTLDVAGVEARLQTGIVVFDAHGEFQLYVWPAERLDFVAYSTMALHVLALAAVIVSSVVGYTVESWPLSFFEIDPRKKLTAYQVAALTDLEHSAFPVAALAGQWRQT